MTDRINTHERKFAYLYVLSVCHLEHFSISSLSLRLGFNDSYVDSVLLHNKSYSSIKNVLDCINRKYLSNTQKNCLKHQVHRMMPYVQHPWIQFFETYQFLVEDHPMTLFSKLMLKNHLSFPQLSRKIGVEVQNIQKSVFLSRHSIINYARLSKVFHVPMIRLMIAFQKTHHKSRPYARVKSAIYQFVINHKHTSNNMKVACLRAYLELANSSTNDIANVIRIFSTYYGQLSRPFVYYLRKIHEYRHLQIGSPAYLLLDYLIKHGISLHNLNHFLGYNYNNPISRVLKQQKEYDTVPYHNADKIIHVLHADHQIFRVNTFYNYRKWHYYRTQCLRVIGAGYNDYNIKVYNLKKRPSLWMGLRFITGSNANNASIGRKLGGFSPEALWRDFHGKILPYGMAYRLIKAYPKYRNYFAYAAQDETDLVSANDLASLVKVMLIHHHLMPIHLSRIISTLISADKMSVRYKHVHLFNDPIEIDFRGDKHIPPVGRYLTYGATSIITGDDRIRVDKLKHLFTDTDLSLVKRAFQHEYRSELKDHHSIFPRDAHKYVKISATCKIRSADTDHIYRKMLYLLLEKAHGLLITQIQFGRYLDNICVATGYVEK